MQDPKGNQVNTGDIMGAILRSAARATSFAKVNFSSAKPIEEGSAYLIGLKWMPVIISFPQYFVPLIFRAFATRADKIQTIAPLHPAGRLSSERKYPVIAPCSRSPGSQLSQVYLWRLVVRTFRFAFFLHE